MKDNAGQPKAPAVQEQNEKNLNQVQESIADEMLEEVNGGGGNSRFLPLEIQPL
ncbi:hypothetical protein [Granulibacter bethesdensis]|uniref:hypothetical protein n=1 Tax=Granulibacter bethesdensis TaxID=364410 RepID=UPI0012FE5741|nr:hypothetical protein [Granulibacter bethesdensis]